MFVSQSFNVPLFEPVVIKFGNSPEVNTAVKTFTMDYPNSVVISYKNIHSINAILTLMRSNSPLILIGHGSNQGILSRNGSVIKWNEIGSWVNTLPIKFVFFLACDSSVAEKYVNVNSYGFPTVIDAVLGAISIAISLNYAAGNTNRVEDLKQQFNSRLTLLKTGKEKLMLLARDNYYFKFFPDFNSAEKQADADYNAYLADSTAKKTSGANWQNVELIPDPEGIDLCVAQGDMNCEAFILKGDGIGDSSGLHLEGHYWVFDGKHPTLTNVAILAQMSSFYLENNVNPHDYYKNINQSAKNIGGGSCGWALNDMWNCIENAAKSISTTDWEVITVLIALGVIAVLLANSIDSLGTSDILAAGLSGLLLDFLTTAPAAASNAYNNDATLTNLEHYNTEIANFVPAISIISPGANTQLSGTFTFEASATASTNELYSANSINSISLYIDSSSSSLITTPPGVNTATVTMNSNNYPSGIHLLTVTATDQYGNFQSTSFEVSFAAQSSSGGSGCVAQNTRILLPDGKHFKKVQALKVGDEVMGYNVSSHEAMTVTVTKIIETVNVSTLLSINDGYLRVTTTEQPIYMRNSTFTGWISDPHYLTVGDQIFNVITNQWVTIYQIGLIQGHFKTYDVATNPLNTFVGNGILLDMPVKN